MSDTHNTDEARALRDYAQQCANLAYWCATHENGAIAFFQSKPYNQTRSLLMSAIRAAYPELHETDIKDVYETWVDCGESIQYCVNLVKEAKMDRIREEAIQYACPDPNHDAWAESGSISDIWQRHDPCRRMAACKRNNKH